jgi:hypothetical protein
MHPLIRSALVLLGGVIVAVLVVVLADTLVASIYPLPAGIDPDDKERFSAAIAALPAPAFLLLLAGWVLAAGFGAYLASRLATRTPVVHGMIVALFVLVATVANLAAIPHPVWLWPAAIILIPAAGWIGARLGAASRLGAAPRRAIPRDSAR